MVRFLLLTFAAALICAAPASASPVYRVQPDGSVKKVNDPYLPPTDAYFAPSAKTSKPESMPATGALSTRGAHAAKKKLTVTSELKRLITSAQIDQASYSRYTADYAAAKRTVKTLRGNGKTQLSAVIKNLDATAAKGKFTGTRMAALFQTLERNRAWWAGGHSIGSGARVTFPGSEIVWQYYPGQGLQIQWLGTFGVANGYLKAKNVQNTKLKLLLDEAAALASGRAGGISWEYLFKFDGGTPPWVSGMATATAMQAFARAGIKYSDPKYNDAARAQSYLTTATNALGVFQTPPPEGVRVNTAIGAHYLIYSFARTLRVQNAFTQTINGLHDFTQLTGNPLGLQTFLAGENELRAETPTYDTGAWSMYSNQREANLNYHNQSIAFLKALCLSLQADDAAAAAGGGVAPGGLPPLDPTVYCTTEAHYRTYLTTPPVLAVQASALKKGKLTALNFSVSKISNVTITVRRGGAVIYSKSLQVAHGNHFVKFKPAKSGTANVTLSATDLAGNKGSATGPVTIR